MMEETDQDQTPAENIVVPTLGAADHVGIALANERKRQERTVEDIAKELNLSVNTIRAIENDHTDGLPELTYVRGYIRSYARLLGLEAEKLLDSYNEGVGDQAVSYDEIPQVISDADILISRPKRRRGIWLALLVVIAVAGYFFYPEITQRLDRQAEVSEPAVRIVSPDASVSDENVGGQIVADQAESNDVSDVLGNQIEPISEPVEPIESLDETVEVSTANTENILTLSFESTCWVDARDSEGTRLAYKSIVGGDQITLNSDLEMTIFLGNAEGATATLNGEPYDISDYRQGVYAKFTIPAVVE
ncbi:MAG: RodZ domain-containing protein [Pseudomonadota bacterium]